MGRGESRPEYFANAAWMLGRLGYPEAAFDLCRRGLELEPGRRALEMNLQMALAESRKEPKETKPRKYRMLTQRARDSGWEDLSGFFGETAVRLERER